MSDTSFDPTVGSPRNPVPLLEQRIELLEGEVQTLHKKLLAARRELALVRGGDPQQALDELLAELERMGKLRVQQEKEQLEQDTKESPQPKESRPPKGHGPREQPNLAVIEKVSELDLDACPCPQCGGRLEPMGEQCEEAEEITILERQYVKKVLKRRKYRCRCNGHIQTAPGIVRLIPGGRYSLDFAIHVAVAKYLDHCVPRRRAQQPRGRRSKSCCMEDEGRPLGIGVQVQVSNHLELRGSRARVVSVEENGAARSRQVRSKKTSESEPLMTCREVSTRRRNRAGWLARDEPRESLLIGWAASGMKAA